MKKNFFKIVFGMLIIGATWSCEKDSTCWICDDGNGNDLPEVCSPTGKEAIENQGGTCWQK